MADHNFINTSSDLTALFEFETGDEHMPVLVSVATLLQCLCISRDFFLTPPLPQSWQESAMPEQIAASVKNLAPSSLHQASSQENHHP
jgi:hypothetical protein